MRTNSFFLFLLLSNVAVTAQSNILSVSEIKHFDPYFDANAREIYRFMVEKITADKTVKLVERKAFETIEAEKERQKNEGFMDGVIADQGKQLGALYILNMEYDREIPSLQGSLVAIESGQTICSFIHDLNLSMKDYQLSSSFWKSLDEDLSKCLAEFHAEIVADAQLVEILEAKSDKAKKLLLYCEVDCNFQRSDKLQIYRLVEKQVGGKSVNYEEVIGQIVVAEVENNNFFNALVLAGDKEIFQLVKSKIMLYAKL